MRSRSRLDICLPLAVFAVLCLSVPTMVVARQSTLNYRLTYSTVDFRTRCIEQN